MFSSILKKTIMSLSGGLLSIFLIVHALGNATSFFGKDAFLSYAEHLHSLGIFINFFELGLLFAFFLHVTFATLTYLENNSARPRRYNVNKNSGGRTIGSMTMPYTGVIIFVFIIFHLRGFHFIENDAPITETILSTLQDPLIAVFYLVSLAAVTIHVSHGFWSGLQTLGISHPKYDNLIRKIPLGISIIVGLIFISIPVLALTYSQFLK